MLSQKNSLHIVRLTIVAVVALGFAQIAHAVPVTNFSFEVPALPDNDFTFPGVSGWTTPGNQWGTWNPGGFYTGDPGSGTPSGGHGSQISFSNFLQTGTMSQSPTTILANTTYSLTTAVGIYNNDTGSGITIELRATSPSVGPILATTTIPDTSLPNGSLSDFAISFNSASFGSEVGNPLFIVYTHTAGGNMSIDNVRLDAVTAEAVPEPSTFVLAVLGLAGMGLVAWRRRK